MEKKKLSQEERYEKFILEYDELRKKYQMEFAMADLWGIGSYTIEVYDTEGKIYVKE